MGFSLPEYWDLPNPGFEPGSPALQADSLPAESPGSAIPGILQARILEWVAISFSNAGK